MLRARGILESVSALLVMGGFLWVLRSGGWTAGADVSVGSPLHETRALLGPSGALDSGAVRIFPRLYGTASPPGRVRERVHRARAFGHPDVLDDLRPSRPGAGDAPLLIAVEGMS